MYKPVSKSVKILPFLLLIPAVSHWIFPSGIESSMYIRLPWLYFYLPNISYILYILVYIKKIGLRKSVFTQNIAILCVMLWIYIFIHLLLFGKIDSNLYLLLINNNLPFVYLSIIFLCFPLTVQQFSPIKPLLIFSLIFIGLQVILLGAGLITLNSYADDMNGADYGGVYRVSTTVGAPTGTALVICIIGIILNSFFKFKKITQYILLLLSTIAIFFSVSRGAILTWSIYILLYYYKNYFHNNKFIVKICSLLVFSGILILLNHYNVFDPLIERSSTKSSIEEMASGRSDLTLEIMNVIRQSDYIGVGIGHVFPDKSIINHINIPNYVRVHNVYLLYLAEIGVLGLFIILLIYFLLLKKLNYNLVSSWMVLIIMTINYNTEMVFTYSEYYPLMLVLLLCNFKQRTNICVTY